MSDGTGIAPVDSVVVWSVGLSAIIGLLVMIARGLRKMSQITKPLMVMLEDWNGQAGRPGVPGRAPLMQRVGDLESDMTSVKGAASALAVRVGGLERGVGSRLLDADDGGSLRGRRRSGG